MPTEAETALLEFALKFAHGAEWNQRDKLSRHAEAVLRERIPPSAIDAYIQQELTFLRAHAVCRTEQAKLGLPQFIIESLGKEARQLFDAEQEAKYVYTGIAATEEEETVMREAHNQPMIVIGNYAPMGGPEVVHAVARSHGLPDIVGHYGYHFKRHEFIHLAGATEGEPDRWPSRKLSDVLRAVGLSKEPPPEPDNG